MPDETKQNPEAEENKKKEKPKKKRSLFHRIVNWFLYFILGIFVLLLILFAITQTSTFREYLRETVISEANSALNGTVYIEKIEGTIFTSLLLRNTVVNMGKDTLLRAEKIVLKTSPLQLLLKRIKVRYFEIENARVALIEDSTGTLNVVNLIPPSPPDTTEAGEFPFKIVVSDFRLTNIDFSLQRYDYVNSTVSYDSLNMNDLRVKNFVMALSAEADINENDFKLELDRFSASPNINDLNLKNLTGDFTVNPENITVDGLEIKTNNSEAELSLSINNFNLFDSTATDNMGDAQITASLESGAFSFNDLTPFVPSMNMMKGAISTDIELSGTINNLLLDKVEVSYLNTHLALTGSVKDLMNSDAMYLRAEFYDTYVVQDDINKLMPSLQVPVYKEAGVIRFDTLTYEGSPLNFKTRVRLRTNIGTVAANGNLNFESPLIAYNMNIRTGNLNIAPFAGVNSNLNVSASVEGRGSSPEELTARVNVTADGSEISGINIDTLRLTANAENRLIEYQLVTASDSMGAHLAGSVDFTNSDNPAYVLEGRVRNVNIAEFTNDTSAVTDLNLTLNAEGENFDPELMNLYLSLTLFESRINNIQIDSTRAIVDLRRDDGGQRVINFISDLADITLIGNFSVPKTIEMLSSEADVVTTIVNNKLNSIMPSALEETNISTAKLAPAKSKNYVELKDTLTSISYLVDLKSLDLISLFLGENKLEVDGDMSGEINSTGDSLLITYNADIEYVKYWGNDDVFFVSNFNLDLSIANGINASSLDDIYADLNLTTDRIFAGTDIHNLNMGLKLQNQKAGLSFSAKLEDYAYADLDGTVDLSGNEAVIALDTLSLTYNHFTLKNDSTINIAYSQSGIDIRDFRLVRNGGYLSIEGTLGESGNQNLNISLSKISGSDVAVNLLGGGQANTFDALINLNTQISGNLSAPVIDLNLDVDSVRYQSTRFGSLTADLDYKDQNLAVDVKFIDSTITANKPALQLNGNVPVNLAFTGAEERFSESGEIDLSLKAENFNLGAFGDILPEINKLRGSMAADLKLSGTFENPDPSGYIRLSNAAFIVEKNNLEYNAGLKVSISRDALSIDSMMIKNAEGTENGGTMRISGKAQLDNLNITSSQFSVNGDLKVLDAVSKTGSAPVYGELVIGTRGNVEFTLDEDGAMLTAPITIKEANLTIPQTQGAYQNTTANFVYKFVEDTAAVGGTGPDFETLVNMSKERSAGQQVAGGESAFDFRIDLEIEDEATIIFPLSRELNQNLTAVLSGNIVYESIDGRSDAQGEFKLLDESTLEFIKTLNAEGTIRFENDLTNPYLDITATYQDYYYEDTNDPVPVAVKIKIKGLLSELDKTFIQQENSIAVYYGEDAIANDNPTAGYDKSDAVYFMITGNFVDQASATPEGGNFATSQAASIAGSVVGGFLNRELGDYVKSVEVQSVGGNTQVNLSGRVNKFRYTIGGNDKVFENIGQANVRIEYPLIEDLLIRLERKRPLSTENTNTNEMINELGLRYRFEF